MSEAAAIPPYRGRLAPSPTGLLHLGHARTFWVAAERARAAGGALVLRIEDLDPQRSQAAYAHACMDDLHWLGLRWGEGPDVGGPHAPYIQSARGQLYRAAWRQLVEGGWAYPCTCSRKDLRESAGAPHEDVDEPIYPGTCRTGTGRPGTCGPSSLRKQAAPLSPAGVNWRFRVPARERIAFDDGRLGPSAYVAGVDFGDFLVWRRDDVPAYQLAVVVDDAAMRITEVVRGADLLLSTARQLLLYRALGLASPSWFHCPLIRDAEGGRLAKHTQAMAIRTLREAGHSPEEVLRMAGLP